MERNAVKSSNIASVGYDPSGQVLEVEFKNGGVYQYSGVEQKQYDGMMADASMGKYFHTNIRAKHECAKIGAKK